ncbi:MAG: biopolymer transporter ExbD [Gammaproteobacteria bacterium]
MRTLVQRTDENEEEQINLTPMLDVVFIMLIFFIVTATFVKEVGLDVNQPDQEKPKTIDPDKKSIVVRITNRDRILIAQRDVDWRSVRANIERLHAENPEAPVIVQPHPDSTTAALVHVMDSARPADPYIVVSIASN